MGDNHGVNRGSHPSGIVDEPSLRRERRVDNHGENTGTRPSGGVDRPSLLAIGLHTVSGEILEVVSSIKVGRSVSVSQVIDHLKKDEDQRTYDLRQRLGVMSANTVEICTACYNTVWTPTLCIPDTSDRHCYFLSTYLI